MQLRFDPRSKKLFHLQDLARIVLTTFVTCIIPHQHHVGDAMHVSYPPSDLGPPSFVCC